ncbi:MAG: multiheme c-type cytochrome [Acidobacteriota bacterium]
MSPESFTYHLRVAILFTAIFVIGWASISHIVNAHQEQKLDPTAWGKNHAGEPVPDFVTGGECLFCHRNTIGATWQKNAHGVTIQQREDAPQWKDIFLGQLKLAPLAKEIEFYLGSRNHLRFLKKSGYGKFAILNTHATLDANDKVTNWTDAETPTWDKDKFANRCVGCHATGVDEKNKTFAQFGHDCYVCHGVVNLEHTNNTSLILLSKKSRTQPQVVTSICASCHLRGGTAKSTGLPYPNNFVPGDNLFQDYQVDFAKADDESLNAGDRHVYRNVRDVVIFGKTVTCLSCHSVHGNSATKHRLTPKTAICSDCHNTETSVYKPAKAYTVKSPLCEY